MIWLVLAIVVSLGVLDLAYIIGRNVMIIVRAVRADRRLRREDRWAAQIDLDLAQFTDPRPTLRSVDGQR